MNLLNISFDFIYFLAFSTPGQNAKLCRAGATRTSTWQLANNYGKDRHFPPPRRVCRTSPTPINARIWSFCRTPLRQHHLLGGTKHHFGNLDN